MTAKPTQRELRLQSLERSKAENARRRIPTKLDLGSPGDLFGPSRRLRESLREWTPPSDPVTIGWPVIGAALLALAVIVRWLR